MQAALLGIAFGSIVLAVTLTIRKSRGVYWT